MKQKKQKLPNGAIAEKNISAPRIRLKHEKELPCLKL